MNNESNHTHPAGWRSLLLMMVTAWTSVILWTCVSVSPYQQLLDEPQLEYQGMEMTGDSAYEVTPVFKFRVVNTNPAGMSVKNVDYDLEINKKTFVKGISGEKVRVRAVDSTNVNLPISFNFKDLFDSLHQLKNTDVVQYDLSGSMIIGPFSVPYQVSGEFKVPQETVYQETAYEPPSPVSDS